MKFLLSKVPILLLFTIAILCPIILWAQTPVDEVKSVFMEYFTYASAAAMYLLIELGKKIPWVAAHLPSRLVSVIIGAVAGITMVFIVGLPPLKIAEAFGLLVFVYNTITGAIKLSKT